jgi:hypothetical protein
MNMEPKLTLLMASRDTAHAVASEFARLRTDTGEKQPTPAQTRAASVERARFAKLVIDDLKISKTRGRTPREVDRARRQLLSDFDTPSPVPTRPEAKRMGGAVSSRIRSTTQYGRY